ncbi:MAG: phosphomannomutase [Thaumarchaeota archaeon]|nr:phosphomannomutase [Nitrososphaerota archaeon]
MPILTISGLRGIVPSDLQTNDFLKAGSAFGHFIQGGTCVVGRDTRKSGQMAANAVIAGLLSKGCRVLDIGITSTPAVFREVKTRNIEGGISVTSSHNPPEWNGAKFIVKPGRGVFEDELLEIKENMGSDDFKNGALFTDETSYPSDIVSFIGGNMCKGVKVAVDLGGGAGCVFLPPALQRLGADVVSLNAVPGIFSRTIDPTADPLDELSSTVKANKCDIGFGYDCDVDRLVIMDSRGEKLPADYTLIFGLRYIAEKEGLAKACISVDTSLSVVKYLNSIKAKIYRAKVGEANVLKCMLDNKCTSGGEGSSGGFIYSPINMCRDGLLISSIVLRLVAKYGSLEKVLEGVETFKQERIKLHCSRDMTPKVMSILQKRLPDAQKIDGIGISGEESWVLIRPSNTEDVIRLSVEAKTSQKAKDIAAEYAGIIESAIKVA